MNDVERPTGDSQYGPATCPYGHVFGPRRILVGWLPCGCRPCREGVGGHRTYQCLTCTDVEPGRVGWTTTCFYPPHLPGTDPYLQRP
jgi:hypothetical protein